MQKLFISTLVLLLNLPIAFAEGPEFDYGYGESAFKWGVEVPITDENSDFKLRLGTRLQSLVENKRTEDVSGNKSSNAQDFYVRRARLQVEAKFKERMSYYMDIRADKIDKESNGKNTFAIGDAFFQVKKLFGSKNLRLRLFRAKYDVSRSQTISSSRLLIPNRASISDFSSEFISKARRGTNAQILGNWSNRIKTQIVIGDSVKENAFYDSVGNKDVTLNGQGLAHGGRIRISPFAGWEEKGLAETQFGHGQHLSLSAGAFFVNNINFTSGSSSTTTEVDRTLYNFDLTFHYGPLSFMGEYFMFDGVVEDQEAAIHRVGESEGFTAQAEYVLTNFHYISPYVRYQSWDRFTDNKDFDQQSLAIGANYYIKGNKLRIGGYYEETDFGDGFAAVTGDAKESLMSLNLMMHY